jgi:hypothetical protein
MGHPAGPAPALGGGRVNVRACRSTNACPCSRPGWESSIGPSTPPLAPHTGEGEWTLGHRARQLYLDPATLAGDLARIGLPVPVSQLGVILSGDEPAPPVVLAGLVDVLELRDPAVGDRPLLTAVAQPWHRAGWPVPTEILTILAIARNLSMSEARTLTAPSRC